MQGKKPLQRGIVTVSGRNTASNVPVVMKIANQNHAVKGVNGQRGNEPCLGKCPYKEVKT